MLRKLICSGICIVRPSLFEPERSLSARCRSKPLSLLGKRLGKRSRECAKRENVLCGRPILKWIRPAFARNTAVPVLMVH
jgi:hypothetical protein